MKNVALLEETCLVPSGVRNQERGKDRLICIACERVGRVAKLREVTREPHWKGDASPGHDWKACSNLFACDRAAVRLFERYHSAKKNLSVFILSFFNLHTVWLFKTAKDK